MNEPFLKPRITGERFKDHALPVTLLSDFSALEELLVELAKQKYLEANPNRKRTPRGFSNEITLNLSSIEEGSVIPTFILASALSTAGLFEEVNPNIVHFESAKETFIEVLNDAENGEITLSKQFIPYFNRIGKSLKDGEAIEFNPTATKNKAILNKETRRSILLSINDEYSDNLETVLAVSAYDKVNQTCTMQNSHIKISGVSILEEHKLKVYQAFQEFEDGTHLKIKGVAKFNVSNEIKMIESIEHADLLDSGDIEVRLEHISSLESGWYYGEGESYKKVDLNNFLDEFSSFYNDELHSPAIYPTVEGGIQLEWTKNNFDVSLSIELASLKGEFHSLNFESDEEITNDLDLNKKEDWEFLNEFIKKNIV